MGERSDFVTVARFEERRRAWRIQDLLADHGIPTRLDTTGDLLAVSVTRADESKALDILVTLVRGIGLDDLSPTRTLQRLMVPETIAAFAALILIATTTALIVWWAVTVAPAVSAGSVAVIILLGALNALRPGRFARKRREADHRPA